MSPTAGREAAGRPTALSYRPQLDGLRTLAVAIVLLSHFSPAQWRRWLPEGLRGVELFFVLSGFLISSILWKGRLQVNAGRAERGSLMARFWLRRTLRIFPIYYLTVAFALFAGLGITIHELKWHVTYLSNVLFVHRGHLGGDTSHFWSLAIEEQFYLLWPALMLLVPKRAFLGLLGVAMLFSPLFRIHAVWKGFPLREYLLPGCLDLFAMGALLAVFAVEGRRAGRTFARVSLAVSIAIWGGMFLLRLPPGNAFRESFSRSAMGLLAVWLIWGANRRFSGAGGRILEAPVIVYLGRISYGIYLFHNFVPDAYSKLHRSYGLAFPPRPLDAVVYSLIAVAAAAASWHFIELPISRLKDRWTRSPRAGEVGGATTSSSEPDFLGERIPDGSLPQGERA